MRGSIATAMVILAVATSATADVNLGQLLPKTPPGGEVALLGANLDAKKVNDYNVTFRGNAEYAVAVEKVEPTRLVLRVPASFTAGPYLVYVKVEAGAPQFVGQIEIVAAAPQIERLSVISAWTKLVVGGQFDFKIIGDRLCVDSARKQLPCLDGAFPAAKTMIPGTKSEVLTLLLDRERLLMGRCTDASLPAPKPVKKTSDASPAPHAPAPASPPPGAADAGEGTAPADAQQQPMSSDTLRKVTVRAPCYWPETPQALAIHGLDVSDYGGPHEMAVEIAGLRSNTTGLRVSRVSPRIIKWMSLGILIGIVLTFGLIGTRASLAPGKSGRSSLLSWVMLDAETNSYSLSKVQLLLWTLAIVYGYLYLLLAYVLTQGKLVFPPLQSTLSVLLMGTGGTSLAAAALSKTRGPKGAGSPDPSISDLVSSGGVLAGDRAQFFIWTLIGVGGFVFLVLRQMPEKIVALPEVPSELLTAMGVSAAVYVLGKSVRLPGPVISTVTVTFAPGAATFDLKIDGVNLHQNATISVNGQAVADATVVPPAAPPPNPASPGMLPQLIVHLPPTGPWTSGDHLLRVTNLDGQFAEVWFAANLPKLMAVAPASIPADVATLVTLTGTDLRPGSSVEWLPPGASEPKLIDAKNVTVLPATATVTFNPGKVKGAGTLTLVSPHGMRTSQPVTIV
jgi:hypothetical protein